MTSRDFVYWLMGYFELNGIGNSGLTFEQAAVIKRHLQLVFVHDIDPQAGDQKKQDQLNAIHSTKDTKMRC